ncbi:unnamed protein product [Ostreobium quekettii]|uniref:Uncharacterized protein n=1 Tax=Ostreobium quekettii TaxID=121088 RepID=A0A8S1JA90_9CHLO|nr:unnamed protein product [Ostreobium quekettii]|eukprot:evm.model.scf_1566.3 EVM.evm.TU.scf_1566.3   scf_1566:25657-26511(+)
MLPFSLLWFPDPTCEARFSRFYANAHFRRLDLLGMRMRLIAVSVNLITQLRRRGLDLTSATAALMVAFNASLDVLWHAWAVGANPDRRNRFMLARRVVGSVVAHIFLGGYFSGPARTPGAFARLMFMMSGVFELIVTTIGVPLLVKYHLLVHVPMVAWLGSTVPARVCAVALETPEGVGYTGKIWGALDALLAGGGTDGRPPPGECCRHIVSMIFVMGVLAPSYVLWAFEYSSRAKWCRLCGSGCPECPPLTRRLIGGHLVAGVLVAACCWLLLHPNLELNLGV